MTRLERITSLKNRLNTLKEHRTDSVKIGNAVEFNGVEIKRDMQIKKIIDALDDLSRLRQHWEKIGSIPEGRTTYIVISSPKMRNGEIIKRTVPTVVNSERLKDFDREEDLTFLYGDPFRVTPPNTLRERAGICVQLINIGKLDDLLGTNPFTVLTQLMGISGELLPRLNIDPKEYIPPEIKKKISGRDQGIQCIQMAPPKFYGKSH